MLRRLMFRTFSLSLVLLLPAGAFSQNVSHPGSPALDAFAARVESTLIEGAVDGQSRVFDRARFIDRVMAGVVASPAMLSGLRRGLDDSNVDPIVGASRDPRPSSTAHLGYFRRDGLDVVRFRRIFDDGGFDIWDIAVHIDPSGV